MKMTRYAALLSYLIAVIFSCDAPAQSVANDWGSVKALFAKTKLIVETKAGRTIKGNVVSVTPSTLNLSLDGRLVVIQQQDVAKVYQGEKGSRFSSALIGAGLGAGIGIGIAAAYIYTTR